VDQTVAASIHAAGVKAARKTPAPPKDTVKAEKTVSPKKISKAVRAER
jgi:hypothetical protein